MDAFTTIMGILALIACIGALITWISNKRRERKHKAH